MITRLESIARISCCVHKVRILSRTKLSSSPTLGSQSGKHTTGREKQEKEQRKAYFDFRAQELSNYDEAATEQVMHMRKKAVPLPSIDQLTRNVRTRYTAAVMKPV